MPRTASARNTMTAPSQPTEQARCVVRTNLRRLRVSVIPAAALRIVPATHAPLAPVLFLSGGHDQLWYARRSLVGLGDVGAAERDLGHEPAIVPSGPHFPVVDLLFAS